MLENNILENNKKQTRNYTLAGIGLGLIFSITGIIILYFLNPSHSGFLDLHFKNPIQFIVECAPLILGIAGYLIGKQQTIIHQLFEEKNEDLESFFNLSADMLSIIDQSGKRVFVNPAVAQMMNVSQKELLGSSIFDSLHPDDFENAKKAWELLKSGQPGVNFEGRVVFKGGNIKWVAVKASPGKEGKFYFITREITDKKNEEAKRLQADQVRQAIIKYANFTIISTSIDGTILTFNNTAEKLLGYSAEEIIGKVTPEIFHDKSEVEARAKNLSKEFGMQINPGFDAFIMKPRLTGKPDENDWTYIRKDKTTFPVRLSVTTLKDENGNISGFLGVGKDITQIHEYQRKLETSEKLMRGFLESLPIGVYIIDHLGKSFFANKKSSELLGKGINQDTSAQELSETYSAYQSGTNQLYPTEELPIVKGLNGETSYIDDMVIDQIHTKIPIEVWATPVKDEMGKVLFSIATFNDISERKNREEKLELLSLVINKTDNAVIIADKEGKIEWVNQGFERITGFMLEEAIGQKPGDLLQGPATDPETKKFIREKLNEGNQVNAEIINYGKSKIPYWLAISITPLIDEKTKEIRKFFAIESDVTSRKKDEIRIKLLLEIAFSFFTAKDLNDAISTVIKNLVETTQWEYGEIWQPESETGTIKITHTHHTHNHKWNEIEKIAREFRLKSDEGIAGTIWKNKKQIWIEDIKTFSENKPDFDLPEFYSQIGSVVGLPIIVNEEVALIILLYSSWPTRKDPDMEQVFSALSIHTKEFIQRKNSEEEKKKFTENIEKTNRELDQFAYIVSHDLKAPLRAMYLLSDWTLEDLKNKENEKAIENLLLLQKRALRMESLIEGILKYSKIGRQNLNNEIIDLDECISQVIDFLSPPKHFKITVEKKTGQISGKRTLLFQVLSNLISNSIKYGNQENGEIDVSIKREIDFILFRIRDNGPGIAEHNHAKIFGMFQRLESRDTIEGTGIGLSLVKKIVEGEGGAISLKSELGKGSTFQFSWPIIGK